MFFFFLLLTKKNKNNPVINLNLSFKRRRKNIYLKIYKYLYSKKKNKLFYPIIIYEKEFFILLKKSCSVHTEEKIEREREHFFID